MDYIVYIICGVLLVVFMAIGSYNKSQRKKRKTRGFMDDYKRKE